MPDSEKQEEQDFKLTIADDVFVYKTENLDGKEKGRLQQRILDLIFQNRQSSNAAADALHIYTRVCKDLSWTLDPSQVSRMADANSQRETELAAKLQDARENLGDIEVRDQLRARAEFLARTASREEAEAAYDATEAITAGAGPKLDLVFGLLRLDIAEGEWRKVSAGLEKARALMAEGGDWERKNRLKVYEGIFCLATRDFRQAADLFLDSIATFTSSELFSYQRCIFYAVTTSMITLERVKLKEKVIDAPEILTVIDSIPYLEPFLNCLYLCDYRSFFKAFADISDSLRQDRFIQPHFRYYIREVRVAAYTQFLESYKSVTLQSMADAFGVSVDFLDNEIADFIVAGRLPAKIDRVAGIIVTNRPDNKNAQYQQTLKQGDLLLNRLQKLSKVVDIE